MPVALGIGEHHSLMMLSSCTGPSILHQSISFFKEGEEKSLHLATPACTESEFHSYLTPGYSSCSRTDDAPHSALCLAGSHPFPQAGTSLIYSSIPRQGLKLWVTSWQGFPVPACSVKPQLLPSSHPVPPLTPSSCHCGISPHCGN